MSSRIRSLDAFRGLTVAAMILVNNPGSWDHVYPRLRHAEWHGWTPTDLIVDNRLCELYALIHPRGICGDGTVPLLAQPDEVKYLMTSGNGILLGHARYLPHIGD